MKLMWNYILSTEQRKEKRCRGLNRATYNYLSRSHRSALICDTPRCTKTLSCTTSDSLNWANFVGQPMVCFGDNSFELMMLPNRGRRLETRLQHRVQNINSNEARPVKGFFILLRFWQILNCCVLILFTAWLEQLIGKCVCVCDAFFLGQISVTPGPCVAHNQSRHEGGFSVNGPTLNQTHHGGGQEEGEWGGAGGGRRGGWSEVEGDCKWTWRSTCASWPD